MIEQSLNTLTMLMVLDAKAAQLPEIFKLYKTLCAAKLKAAYKADLLLKEFAPPAPKAKAVKKTVAAKKSTANKAAPAKKTSNPKKPAAKPKANATKKPPKQ